MANYLSSIDFLNNKVNQTVEVHLTTGDVLTGKLIVFDDMFNLVLQNVQKKTVQLADVHLDDVFVRGNNVRFLLECE